MNNRAMSRTRLSKWRISGHRRVLSLLVVAMFFFTPIVLAADEGRWQEAYSEAGKLYQAGRYVEAIPFAQEGLRVAEAAWGADDQHVAVSLNILASLYKAQGRYGDAEPLYRRS